MVLGSLGLRLWAFRPGSGATARINVVLISIDTLRADHLGTYGYGRDTSPHLDALAVESVVFENAYSQASWTLPSHVTMFTGLDPLAHGVMQPGDRLTEDHITLAERLLAAGYRTAAWVGRNEYSFVGANRGFAQGFESYAHAPHTLPRNRPRRLPPGRRPDQLVGKGAAQTAAVLRWLDAPSDEPFFLFVHLDDVHSQATGPAYNAPAKFRDRFCPGALTGYSGCEASGPCGTRRLQAMHAGDVPLPLAEELEKITCLYDGAIAFVDAQVGRLIDGLRERGLLDRTLVIVTADHGESLMEHGEFSHFTVYEEVARVPLVVRFPAGAAARRETARVGLVDLVPTILETVGLDPPDAIQGASLLQLEHNDVPPEHETTFAIGVEPGAARLWRRGNAKYVRNARDPDRPDAAQARDELYDLAADPLELTNRIASDSELALALSSELDAHERAALELRAARGKPVGDATLELPAEEKESLEALGYGR